MGQYRVRFNDQTPAIQPDSRVAAKKCRQLPTFAWQLPNNWGTPMSLNGDASAASVTFTGSGNREWQPQVPARRCKGTGPGNHGDTNKDRPSWPRQDIKGQRGPNRPYSHGLPHRTTTTKRPRPFNPPWTNGTMGSPSARSVATHRAPAHAELHYEVAGLYDMLEAEAILLYQKAAAGAYESLRGAPFGLWCSSYRTTGCHAEALATLTRPRPASPMLEFKVFSRHDLLQTWGRNKEGMRRCWDP